MQITDRKEIPNLKSFLHPGGGLHVGAVAGTLLTHVQHQPRRQVGLPFIFPNILGESVAVTHFLNAFRVCTAKVFDKSDPEGDDAAKRELKNLKSLRHERMVSPAW